MELNKLEFLQAENFTVELVLKNIGNQSVTLVWPDGYVFDFVVKDVNETLVYNWGGEHVYPLMVINIALDIGQNMTWGFTWHQKLVADHWVYPKGLIPKGTYYVKGIVRPFDLHVESQVTLIGISLETPSITFIVR